MVVGAFPVSKLASIALKQLSKPFASRIKNGAKRSPVFRNYICMPPAQLYHWIDVTIKMRMLNLGKPTEVPKLNENMAIELGAELLGEGIVFAVAAACLIAEYIRSSKKEREKEEMKEARTEDILRKLAELELQVAEHDTKMRELTRVTYGVHTSVAEWWKKRKDNDGGAPANPPSPSLEVIRPQSGSDRPIIHRALDEVDKAMKGKRG